MSAVLKLITILLVSSGLLLSVHARPQTGETLDKRAIEIERLVHILINRERAREDAKPLAAHSRLTELARSHSKRMAEKGFFSHEDPQRGGLRTRLERAGIRWTMIAENISYA